MKNAKEEKISGKKKAIITIAISLLLVMFLGYGIEVFDPTPDYDELCPYDLYLIHNQTGCESEGGAWTNQSQNYREPYAKPLQAAEGGENISKIEEQWFCETPAACYEKADGIREQHDKIVFISGIILGIIAVIIGILLKTDAVSTGILAGGVLTILYGTIRYWSHANDTLKFILLGIALAVLILIGYKMFEKMK